MMNELFRRLYWLESYEKHTLFSIIFFVTVHCQTQLLFQCRVVAHSFFGRRLFCGLDDGLKLAGSLLGHAM